MDTSGGLRIALAGGGTGGHLYPGVALAAALQVASPKLGLHFIGSSSGLERELLPRLGHAVRVLPLGRGSPLSLRRPVNALRFVRSLLVSRSWLRELAPHVVVALGGYAAAPLGMAAGQRRVPLILLEQNAVPGRVTRLLSRWACQIHLQFAEAEAHLRRTRASVRVSGSPVRDGILALAKEGARGGRELLVIGGSQGAERLNALFVEAGPSLARAGVRLIHLTGPREHVEVARAYAAAGTEHEALAYVDDMAALYRRARLVVARAGASTAAELGVLGLPALLVPFPAARDDHQAANAQSLARVGAAVVAPEAELTGQTLLARVLGLWQNDDALQRMGAAMKTTGRPAAAAVIAAAVLEAAGGLES